MCIGDIDYDFTRMFNLLNENKEVVFGNLVTNTNGQIVLENMIPGKYYLEETETQETSVFLVIPMHTQERLFHQRL